MRIKLFILSFLVSLSAISQQSYYHGLQGSLNDTTPVIIDSGTTFRGVWGYGQLNSGEIDDYGNLGTEAAYKGYYVLRDWAEIETSDNVFNWTDLDDAISQINSYGLYPGVQVQVGPSCPAWLLTLAGTYTTNSGANIYPKYYNTNYETRYLRFVDTLGKHLLSKNVTVWGVTVGKTGDRGPDDGNPDPPYDTDPEVPTGEDSPEWVDFIHAGWQVAWDAVDPTITHPLFNVGNDHYDNDYVDSAYGWNAWIKEGRLSHNYVFDGQAIYQFLPAQLSRGEIQGYPLLTTHEEKDGFAIVSSAVGLGLGILNTPTGWYNQGGGSDTRLNAFFNRYANDTIASTSEKAFVQLGLPISIDSIGRWSEGTFGQLISPGDEAALAADTNAINASSYDESYKLYLKLNKVIQYTNNARITALASGTGTDANEDINGDDYDNDFVWAGVNNFSKFIIQTEDGHPEYRIGPDTSIYGRFAKSIDTANSQTEMSFEFESGWDRGLTTDDLTFTVTYFNRGTGQWSLQADTGSGIANVSTVTNTNTNQWKQLVVTVSDAVIASEFKLHYISGRNTIFTLIEVKKATQ